MAKDTNEVDRSEAEYKLIDQLRNLGLFSGLAEEELKLFADAAKIKKCKKGHILFNENEEAQFLYSIRSGWIRLCPVK